ncbi:hypothetical protein AWN90_40435 [Nocardia terpenica]|uniref:Uncharacterized protein n=2 Tax=Nocardia terpenica TaxID=455432 RepID=A0A164JXM0_9NOCA|nr:hypothetical protein AWN90_40435 [Nocardia terpenica]
MPGIREWLCAIEDKAGAGYRVEREPQPPYGWNLVDPSGAIVCSGTLDRLESWVIDRTASIAESTTGEPDQP